MHEINNIKVPSVCLEQCTQLYSFIPQKTVFFVTPLGKTENSHLVFFPLHEW